MRACDRPPHDTCQPTVVRRGSRTALQISSTRPPVTKQAIHVLLFLHRRHCSARRSNRRCRSKAIHVVRGWCPFQSPCGSAQTLSHVRSRPPAESRLRPQFPSMPVPEEKAYWLPKYPRLPFSPHNGKRHMEATASRLNIGCGDLHQKAGATNAAHRLRQIDAKQRAESYRAQYRALNRRERARPARSEERRVGKEGRSGG